MKNWTGVPIATPANILTQPAPGSKQIGPIVFDTVKPVVLNSATEEDISKLLAAIITQGKLAPGVDLAKDLGKIGAFAGVETTIGLIEELTPSAAFIISTLLKSVADVVLDPNFRDIEYQSNYSNPNKIVDTQVALDAFHRGNLTKADLLAHLQKEGIGATAAETLIEVAKQLNSIGALISLRFRGDIATDEEFTKRASKLGYEALEALDSLKSSIPLLGPVESLDMFHRDIIPQGWKDAFDDLRKGGWTEDRIGALRDSRYTLPNVFNIQDFTVRQVDNPEVVQKFQLDHLRDDAYMLAAKKLGYSAEDATKIYRYYWEYPPFFQVARLFTNGRLPEADFRDILGFLRFTPYWVDRLVDDMKPQLTQADIKDQYKYQVISGAEISPALQKVGVAKNVADDLQKLWIASVKLATPNDTTGSGAAAQKIKGDTLQLVIKAYKDGILDTAGAMTNLETVGYTDPIIQLELSIADYEIHQQQLKDLLTITKEELASGAIVLTDAITQMSAAGATSTQLDLYNAEFYKIVNHKPALPTKAELKAWYKAGLLSPQELADNLSLLGIGSQWIPNYLVEYGVDPAMINSITF